MDRTEVRVLVLGPARRFIIIVIPALLVLVVVVDDGVGVVVVVTVCILAVTRRLVRIKILIISRLKLRTVKMKNI